MPIPARPEHCWPAVHVAGIMDLDEAEMLVECGLVYLGFPVGLDYHQEDLSAAAAAAVVRQLDGRATCFVITYLASADEIVDLVERVGVKIVQLHGDISCAELGRLQQKSPNVKIIKSLIVRPTDNSELFDDVKRLARHVYAFITDTFDPATGATGATGKTHDWQVSRRLVAASPRPVILAGGLNAANVGPAIRSVRPAGVDVHTGIEGPDGRKRAALAAAFAHAAGAAFAGRT